MAHIDGGLPVEEQVYRLLLEKGLTVSTAESCTGGLVAASLVNVPGISEVFRAGYITYANEAKREILRVKENTLQKYGAVSAQTAAEMAEGAALAAHSDCGVATTGIAGPDGGTPAKPVGLVYIGCFVGGRTSAREYCFSGGRAEVRRAAAEAALSMLAAKLREHTA